MYSPPGNMKSQTLHANICINNEYQFTFLCQYIFCTDNDHIYNMWYIVNAY